MMSGIYERVQDVFAMRLSYLVPVACFPVFSALQRILCITWSRTEIVVFLQNEFIFQKKMINFCMEQ
jgi:hypothetical protein